MSIRCRALFILAASLLSSSIAFGLEEKILKNDSEENKVIEVVNFMTSAFQEKNLGHVMASYEKGAAIMFSPQEKVTDPTTIAEMFEGAFQINPKFDYPDGHEVYISNGIALHIAPWTMKGNTPEGTTIEQKGLSIAVLRKQEDGNWLLVLDNPHGQILLKN